MIAPAGLRGRAFKNPVLLASGTAGYGTELEGVVDLDTLGGIVTKCVSLLPRHGNPAPRVAEFPGGMMNSVGLANPGLEVVRTRELPALLRRAAGKFEVIVNVVGFTLEEYAEVVAGLESFEGIAAFELNLSCPNTSHGGIEFGAEPESVAQIVRQCAGVTKRPLLAKLSPVLSDIAAIAEVAVGAGAAGISLVNTFPGTLSEEDGAPRLGAGKGGVSGPPLLPLGVLAVKQTRQKLPNAVIVGVGGIRSAEDARQYLRAGADLVAIGTAGLADPRLPVRVARDLEQHRG
ncbi:MAG TPA: dihydroorotate dehydrogenase [Gemmatimonadales bacterium]|nr:dihydroorotate dehydrogenase [Gemmatimonadales bacterium]